MAMCRRRRGAITEEHVIKQRSVEHPVDELDFVGDEDEVGSDGEWENLAMSIYQQDMGQEKFKRRIAKQNKKHTAGLGSRTRLTFQMSRIKKLITAPNTGTQHYNAIGAVGYAVVRPDPRIPEDTFFVENRRFRVRLRHCAIRCEDDGSSCVRQAALKFADQNEDGPMDLVLFTGRAALARNAKTYVQALQDRGEEAMLNACKNDPQYCFALVDGLRRAPSSYSTLRYHSQLPYLFTARDEKLRLAKFRLVPHNACDKETGLLNADQQRYPWRRDRSFKDKRPIDYLRRKYRKQLEDSPVKYRLQIQVRGICGTGPDDDIQLWNPQNIWDESRYPWLDLMHLIFTTPLPQTATNRTAFNVVNRPKCLDFLSPSSVWDYKSYHTSCSTMYTTMELKELNQINADMPPKSPEERSHKISYVVKMCIGAQKSNCMLKIDFIMTLTGVSGRTAPIRLDRPIKDADDDEEESRFRIDVDDVGDILSVTLAVRHRQLMADCMLRYVILTQVATGDVRFFPCHRVVLSKVTLRPGNVCLPQNEIHEVVRQERALEIRDRQQDYTWRKHEGLPSTIRAVSARDLPAEQRLLAEKFAGLPWDLEFTVEEVNKAASPGGGHLSPSTRSPTRSYFNFEHQKSVTDDDELLGRSMGRRRSVAAFQTMPVRRASMFLRRPSSAAPTLTRSISSSGASSGNKNPVEARRKWSKIKLALHFIACTAAKIPPGVKGDMCRAVLDDADFGRLFIQGPNPTMLQRIVRVPEKMSSLTDEMMQPFMERELSFTQEMQVGRVFLVDYAALDGVPEQHKDGALRYCAAPMVILYANTSGDLVPLAIQLRQTPSSDDDTNPIWVPNDAADGWLLAKLWVRFADSINQFASHVFYCHLVVEPFAVATVRQLPESHPIFKLLKPHFRYLLVGNTLMRANVSGRGGALDRWTSVGFEGNRAIMRYLYENFHLDHLDMLDDLHRRGVQNNRKLTSYHYREDGIRLWNAVHHYCTNMVGHFYTDDADVVDDCEIQAWLRDVREHGFPGRADDIGLPVALTEVTQLAELMTKILFTATCRHAATHSEAMDMYGHDAAVPATMWQPPPKEKVKVSKDMTADTLPDQKPELYNTAMAYIMSLKRADPSALGQSLETYFVESEAKEVHDTFRKQLAFISNVIKRRNANLEHPYETLLPENIPNSVEPLPFLPGAEPELDADLLTRDDYGLSGPQTQRSVPLLAMPICMTFAKSIGGKSALGRRLSVNVFSQAMSGVNMERVNVPMNVKERCYGYGALDRSADQPY